MSAKANQMSWNVRAIDPPTLTSNQWLLGGAVGLVLFVAAVLQLVSFSDFRDNFNQAGLPGPTAWAVCIILAELWGVASFFRLRLSYFFRLFSATLTVLVALFWFVYNAQLAATGTNVKTSNYFGRFLNQQPGWWSIIEITIFIFVVIAVFDWSRSVFMARAAAKQR